MQNPPYNILIVEDDKIDQLAFKRAMKEYSSLFVYTIADNFEKACNFLEHNDFDLIISDFNLGDGTGLDIVKKYGHIPTIMVTASDDIEAAVNSLRNGARDYIVKDRLSKYLEVLPLTAKKVLDHFQAEIKARDSEERFRELFENSSDLIQSVSVEGNFNYVNPEWKKVLQYNDDEIKNINLLDIIYPEDRKHCKEMLDELFSGIDFKSTEIRFISKKNEVIYVEGEVRCRFINNIPVSTQAIFKNITSKRIAEEQLKNSEKQYRMLVENASDMIFKLNNNLDITFVNSVCATEIGYTNEELLGKNLISIVSEDHKDEIFNRLVLIFNSQTNDNIIEYPVHAKNGDLIWIGQNTTRVTDITGSEEELLIVARNITRQKLEEIELRLTNVELEKIVENRTLELKHTNNDLLNAQDELNLFLYKSSHNLMGPSSRLQGLINLQKNSATTLNHEDFLHMFETNTIEIRKIIEKLSWVSVFHEKIEKTKVDFKEIFEKSRQEVINEENEKGLELYTDFSHDCTVLTDPSLLKLITINVLENAVMYRKNNDPLHKVHVSAKVNNSHFTLEINDSGIGINNDIQSKVFDMFYRGTELSKGNGLGLYLVNRALKVLNGSITITSEENKFTKVNIQIY